MRALVGGACRDQAFARVDFRDDAGVFVVGDPSKLIGEERAQQVAVKRQLVALGSDIHIDDLVSVVAVSATSARAVLWSEAGDDVELSVWEKVAEPS